MADDFQSELAKYCANLRLIRKFLCWGFFSIFFLIFILILCLNQNPTYVNCRVTNALLTESNFTLEVTIRNPNSYFHVHHDDIDITVYYKNQALGSRNYSSFSQGRKHETHLTPSFQGLTLGGGESNDSGADIVVKLNMKDEYKRMLLPKKRFHRKLEYTCELKVPLIQSGNGNSFHTTRCTYRQIP